MSDDSIIYVKQIDKKWFVWRDYGSTENPTPSDDDRSFYTQEEALVAAHDLHDEIGAVEFGVYRL